MNTPNYTIWTQSIIFTVLVGLWSSPALAYLDPGSGSAIMSAIIGAIVAGFLAIKTYWYKLKSIFFGKKKSLDKDIESGSGSKE